MRVSVCAYMCVRINMYERARTCMCMCMRACVCARARACMRVCARAYVCVCVRARAYVHACMCVRACVLFFQPVCHLRNKTDTPCTCSKSMTLFDVHVPCLLRGCRRSVFFLRKENNDFPFPPTRQRVLNVPVPLYREASDGNIGHPCH